MAEEQAADGGIEINGRMYEFPSSFTFEEARQLKRLTETTERRGMTLSELRGADFSDPDLATWLVWVLLHRDTGATVAEVCAMDLDTVKEVPPRPGPDRPPDQAAEAAKTTSPAPSEPSAPKSSVSPAESRSEAIPEISGAPA